MSLIQCLWRVSRPSDENIGYDEFDSFVCVAATASVARRFHPRGEEMMVWVEADGSWHPVLSGTVDEEPWEYHSWTTDIDRLEVVWRGQAADGALRVVSGGVILASFNAG